MSNHFASLVTLTILAAGCSIGAGLGSNQGTGPTPAPATTTNAAPTHSSGPAAAQPTFVVLPDLTGMSEEDARKKLADAGITGNVYTDFTSGCESHMRTDAGMVCGQHPPAGAKQGAGLAITLHLARTTSAGPDEP